MAELVWLIRGLVAVMLCAGNGPVFQTDPQSAELEALARPLVVDESAYGCGPLAHPGKTYYVSCQGEDQADGLSWNTAWRHVERGMAELAAGDTLVIGEGEYVERPLAMNVKRPQTGLPGRPITIKAAAGQRVVITGAHRPELARAAGKRFTCQASLALDRNRAAVWESDTQILLQQVAGPDAVEELPGTWCYDAAQKRLYAHFCDSRGPDVHGLAVCPGKTSLSNFRRGDPCGLDMRASYVRLQGLGFRNFHTALVVQGTPAQAEDGSHGYRGGDHVTVEDCSFSSTCFAGLVLFGGAQWNLVKNNYGTLNGPRGSLLANHAEARDNLFVGNRLDPSGPTVRFGQWNFHYGISTYGTVGPRNHVIGNVLNDSLSYRTKYMVKESVLQGNVMIGSCGTVPVTYYPLDYRPEDRVVFRNNVLLGPVITAMQPMPPCGAGGNWCDPFKAFLNNFVPAAPHGAAAIAAARFADPAWLDFRLQGDSPLRGRALGGGDVGAYPGSATGQVLYVSLQGCDENPGTSERRPLATLAKAAAALGPGDTLYVLPGVYREPLVVRTSGTERKPITIRAHGRKVAVLPAVVLNGSWITLAGFRVSAKNGDGVTVGGRDVVLKECTVHHCARCAVRVTGTAGIEHCTLAGNGCGLALEGGGRSIVRDCILAGNREAAVEISGRADDRLLASHNCYFGPGLDARRVETEVRSVVADPKFVDVAKSDFRLACDSPAAHLAPFGRPAGAQPALVRTPEIQDIEVSGLCADTAIVTWRTPKDDTTGSVSWREKGQTAWRTMPLARRGTVHGVGLSGLKPQVEYEFTIQATGRREGSAISAVRTLKTSGKAHEPATYHVSPSGDDRADGRTLGSAWKTLRRASFAVAPGDTVLIAPGVYGHPIAPLRGGSASGRITFRGHGRGDVIVDAGQSIAPLVDLAAKDFITVEGLVFDNLPPEGHAGVVRVDRSRGFELLNCRIGHKKAHGGFGNGAHLTACRQARIEGNVIWGTRYHCVLSQCTDTLVKNNTFARGQVFSTHFLGNHEGCRFVNNIFSWPTSVPNAALAIVWPSKDLRLTSDYNFFGPMVERTQVAYVYRNSVLDIIVPGPKLADWQQGSAQDRHSRQGDPLFVDPERGDFRLRPGSPAIGAGEAGANMGACGVAEGSGGLDAASRIPGR